MNWKPFIQSQHGHPNFNPAANIPVTSNSTNTSTNVSGKVSKNFSSDSPRNSKQPKAPDKPITPYMRYNKKIWDEVRAQYSDLKVWDVSKIIGQMWRDLDENEKQKYIDEYKNEMIDYNEALKQYHSSSEYLQWFASLKQKENDDRETTKRKEKRSGNQLSHNSPQKAEARYSLQSLDLDENEEYFSHKHLATARYYRNNKLINDIFSDTVVPDMRSTYETKVQALRRQVDSLTVYQKKLNEELAQIEENFQQKKRSLLESSEKFQSEMAKRFSPNDLDQAVKEHYRKTLTKTIETLKGINQNQQQSINLANHS